MGHSYSLIEENKYFNVYVDEDHPGGSTSIRVYKLFRRKDVKIHELMVKMGSLPDDLDTDKVCPVAVFWDSRGNSGLSMPFFPAGNLRQYVDNNVLNADRKRRLTLGITSAMQYLHARGVYHGNLHPGNILINNEGEPLISDIKLRLFLAELNIVPEERVQENARYLAPETLTNGGASTPSGPQDVYSLACVIFELLSGQAPFSNIKIGTAVVARIVRGTHAVMTKPDNLSQEVWCVLCECWQENPTNRPDLDYVLARLRNARFS